MPVDMTRTENNVKSENDKRKKYLKGYRTNRRRVNRIDDE